MSSCLQLPGLTRALILVQGADRLCRPGVAVAFNVLPMSAWKNVPEAGCPKFNTFFILRYLSTGYFVMYSVSQVHSQFRLKH